MTRKIGNPKPMKQHVIMSYKLGNNEISAKYEQRTKTTIETITINTHINTEQIWTSYKQTILEAAN